MKYIITCITTFLIRLIRIFPNNDPIMGTMLPFAREKWWKSFLYVVLAMVGFDLITGKLGMWTLWTSLTYGVIALLFVLVFKKMKQLSMSKYIGACIGGVLLFDIITGPIMTSMLFRTPFILTTIAHIPFTIFHLLSGVVYTFLFVPVLDPTINQNLNVVKQTQKIYELIKQKVFT